MFSCPVKKESKLNKEKELKVLISGHKEEKKEIEIKIRKAKIEIRHIKAKKFMKNAVYKGKPNNKRKERH